MKRSRSSPTRIFVDAPLTGDSVRIADRDAHYLSHVLRLKVGSPVLAFDGGGHERLASVASLARGSASLELHETLPALPESAVPILLIQALVKSEAMDLVAQKATELGVSRVLAVKTDYSVVKLDAERGAKRKAHWERIARSACEQSGRHAPPAFEVASSLAAAIGRLPEAGIRVAFDPDSARRFASLEAQAIGACLAVGPEGGFSPAELEQLGAAGFVLVGLGARILRAETAAITACALAQMRWGDFA
jgi:16S rRNA (uracil1498-N3)-methyltransferase